MSPEAVTVVASATSSLLTFSVLFVTLLPLLVPTRALLYPKDGTSLGLVSSVSYPVVEYLPERSILIDWCFQMSYNLPATVAAFYNIPVWPGHSKTKRQAVEDATANGAAEAIGDTLVQPEWLSKYGRNHTENRHAMDLSAGELYQGIEDYLVGFGFHETCLLRSVCELAQHPFDDKHQNVITKLLTFILTPSLHQGFTKNEQIYRQTYEAAEMRGIMGENCTALYADCKRDILSTLTRVILIYE